MALYKPGNRIGCINPNHGFSELLIIEVISKKRRGKEAREYYRCKIPNGEVTIPVSAEDNYQLLDDKKK